MTIPIIILISPVLTLVAIVLATAFAIIVRVLASMATIRALKATFSTSDASSRAQSTGFNQRSELGLDDSSDQQGT